MPRTYISRRRAVAIGLTLTSILTSFVLPAQGMAMAASAASTGAMTATSTPLPTTTPWPAGVLHPAGLLPDAAAATTARPVAPSSNRIHGFTAPPASYDLSTIAALPSVRDQGSVNSCVSWVLGYYMKGWYAARDGYYPTGGIGGFAPMYLYTQVTAREGKPGQNVTTYFSDQFAVAQNGIDTEGDYTNGDSNYTTQPTAAQIKNASPYSIATYTTLSVSAISTTISGGNPIALAMPIYPEFEAWFISGG